MFADCLTHTLHGECDENQHKGLLCDNKRTMELFLDTGRRPQVTIRFNPDGFIDARDQKQEGCFYLNKRTHLCVHEERWESRYKEFKRRMEYHMTHVPEKEIIIEQLFYDGYDIQTEQI